MLIETTKGAASLAENTGRQQEHDQLKESIRNLTDELNEFHKKLADFNQKVEAIEIQAGDAGLESVKFAIRDAYINISQAGSFLVKAHLNLNVSLSVFDANRDPQA